MKLREPEKQILDDFSILNFIQEINNLFHSQIDEKKQILTTKKNIRHEWVNGDQLHLMQIFNNLLSNAVKYTQEGGEIQFLVEECETNSSVYAKYRFLVRDNGIGMSADFKDKIFDAFTRAENSAPNKAHKKPPLPMSGAAVLPFVRFRSCIW